MPKPRDPERAREAILAAARTEFARHGPAGARVDRIAAAAGFNKRMIYHYFGSKDGLWSALLAEPLVDVPLLGDGPGLLDVLQHTAQRLAAEPEAARLLVWEALGEAPVADADGSRRMRWSGRVDEVLQAQRDGRLAAGIDAAQLATALTALVLFPAAFPQLTRLITGDVPPAQFEQQRGAFFAQLGALLAARPAKPRLRLNAAVTRRDA